jgi:hypothetical protein
MICNVRMALGAGLCQAVVHVLKFRTSSLHRQALHILSIFMPCLTEGDFSVAAAAMGVLVAGGVVELTISHMAEAGMDSLLSGLGLLEVFLDHKIARDRMCDPAVVKQLTKWLATCLKKVRDGGILDVTCILAAPQAPAISPFVPLQDAHEFSHHHWLSVFCLFWVD